MGKSLGLSLFLWGLNCPGGCWGRRWTIWGNLGGSCTWDYLQFRFHFKGSSQALPESAPLPPELAVGCGGDGEGTHHAVRGALGSGRVLEERVW